MPKTLIEILVLLLYALLIALSAFFSSCEITFARANKKRIEKDAENGDRRARNAKYIQDNYTRSLSTILVSNNLTNIAASSAATVFFVRLLDLRRGELIATVITTLLLIVFGETMPKIIAADRPDGLSRRFSSPLKAVMGFFKPLVTGVEKLVNKLSPIWTPKEQKPQTTTDELRIVL
jgi:Mg2+/Co2+ transporter CorB